jgi:hypothetical protein
MIKVFNSANPGSERILDEQDVTVRGIRLNAFNEPILTFTHADFPLGDLQAVYSGTVWECDLD